MTESKSTTKERTPLTVRAVGRVERLSFLQGRGNRTSWRVLLLWSSGNDCQTFPFDIAMKWSVFKFYREKFYSSVIEIYFPLKDSKQYEHIFLLRYIFALKLKTNKKKKVWPYHEVLVCRIDVSKCKEYALFVCIHIDWCRLQKAILCR